MSIEPPMNDARQIWQNQPTEPLQMSPKEIRRKAEKFQRRIRARNMREYIAAAIVIVFFAFNFVKSHAIVARIGSGLIVAGTLYLVYQLYTRGAARRAPANTGAVNYLDFYRSELERQRDLLRHIWRWYLGPLIPGFAVLVAGSAIANPQPWIVAYIVASAALLLAVTRWNLRKAHDLQRQIEEIDALRRQS